MGPLSQAISSGSIGTAMSLAPNLYTRHGPFANWSTVWWKTILRGIQNAESRKAASIINAALGHIEHCDNLTDDTLDSVVSTWLDSATTTDMLDLLASKSASVIIDILLNLVARRRLRIVPLMLEKLAYAVWKQAGTAIIVSKGHLSNKSLRAFESSMTLAQHLLLTTPPNPELPPINLQQSLILQTERGVALNGTNVPSLIRHLPFLVVIDTVRGTSPVAREQISTLMKGLATTPQFKAAAFRHLHILKDAFLSNEWSKPSLDAAIETAMVDALKLIMSQGSSCEPTRRPRPRSKLTL